jgi:phage repressor protein C with HTH and peptisase S24 domain
MPAIFQFLHLCRLYGVSNPYATFVDNCDELNEAGWERLREYIDLLKTSRKYIVLPEKKNVRSIALYLLPASAGRGQFLDSGDYEMVEADDSVPLSANFGIHVSGDSMEPRYHDGDAIWVQQRQTLENGEIGVFLYDGNAYLKMFRQNGEDVTLVSLNEKYSSIEVNGEFEFRIFGRVVS